MHAHDQDLQQDMVLVQHHAVLKHQASAAPPATWQLVPQASVSGMPRSCSVLPCMLVLALVLDRPVLSGIFS